MARVFIGIGSNIDPERHIPESITRLARAIVIIGASTFYRTQPVGFPGQPAFVNGVISAETDDAPERLKFEVLRRIEVALGRHRDGDRYAPRTIDLDLLLYDDRIIHTTALTLPDPEITCRPFLAIPLCELAPSLILPGGAPICEIAASMDASEMEVLPELTALLREVAAHESHAY